MTFITSAVITVSVKTVIDEPLIDTEALRTEFRPGGEWAKESGARLRRARKDLKLTLVQFAQLADSTAATVSRVELGEVIPRFSLMAALAYVAQKEIEAIWPMPSRRRIRERAAA